MRNVIWVPAAILALCLWIKAEPKKEKPGFCIDTSTITHMEIMQCSQKETLVACEVCKGACQPTTESGKFCRQVLPDQATCTVRLTFVSMRPCAGEQTTSVERSKILDRQPEK